MGHFACFLDLAGRPCVVIGGGAVAERKVRLLLDAGACVTVVSPALTSGLAALAATDGVRHLARPYRAGDLRGAVLAFAATGDPVVSAAVSLEGRRRRVWVNAADDPVHCDFILPSVLRRGRLTVAVSTGGASPAVARAVREELEQVLTTDHAALLDVASDVRADLRARGMSADAERWRGALGRPVRRLAAAGRTEAARRELTRRLGAVS
jgi:siroheme synthase-like protein